MVHPLLRKGICKEDWQRRLPKPRSKDQKQKRKKWRMIKENLKQKTVSYLLEDETGK